MSRARVIPGHPTVGAAVEQSVGGGTVRPLRAISAWAVSSIAMKKQLAGDLMAYVGGIAGALPTETCREMLLDARFSTVEVVDTGANLNPYAKVENQAACLSPVPEPQACGLPLADPGCLHSRARRRAGRHGAARAPRRTARAP
ncbi:hypothetical protein AB1L88_03820 [Tautonia sp. JC769]|uniref:hypothetical protein n=1 Tax=Tautonia sp. JC769 TaxID=3232135 RepID=UPI003457A6A2